MKSFLESLFAGVFIASILGLLLLVGMTIYDWGHSAGYCEALSGSTITSEVCNVDGRVVDIP